MAIATESACEKTSRKTPSLIISANRSWVRPSSPRVLATRSEMIPPTARAKQSKQAECADSKASILNRQVEVVEVIGYSDRVDEQFDAKRRAIASGEQPDPVVFRGGLHDVPSFLLTDLRRDALTAHVSEVTLRGVLGESPVKNGNDQHQYCRQDLGIAPGQVVAETESDDAAEHERHDALRDTAASVTPATHCRVRGSNHVRREHDRRMELGNHEARADDSNQQTKNKKRSIVPGKCNANHGHCTKGQQGPCR